MAIDTSKLMLSSLGLIGSGIGAYTNLSPIEDIEQYISQALLLGNSNYQLGSLQRLADLYAQRNIPQSITGNTLYNPSALERFGQLFGSGLSGFAAGYNFSNNFTGDIENDEFTIGGKAQALGGHLNKFSDGGTFSKGAMIDAASGLAMAGINMGLNAIAHSQRRKQAEQDALRYNALRDFAIDRNTLDFQRAIDDSTDNIFNMAALQMKANGGKIYIKPSKRGTFTAAAKSRGMGVQEFASKVLANKEDYSTAMVKKANFARNAAKWHDEGGSLFTNGGIWSNGLTFIGNGGTHELNPFEGVPMGIAPDGIPNLVEEGEVIYNDYVFSDRLKVSKKMLDKYMLPSKYEGKSYAEVSKELSKESEERPNDPISKKGLEDSMAKLQLAQEEYKAIRDLEKTNKLFAYGGKVRKYSGLDNVSSLLNIGNIDLENYDPLDNRLALLELGITPPIEEISLERYNPLDNMRIRTGLGIYSNKLQDKSKPAKQEVELPKDEEKKSTEKKQPSNLGDSTAFDTNSILRYAPTLIQGIQALKGNKVDYTNPNLIAANTKSINFTPLGDYMALERLPFVSTIGNKMQAQLAATNAAIMNAAANRAAAISSLITSGYKGQTALADAALEAAKYNNLLALTEAEFNRGTNQANLTAGLEVARANQQLAYLSAVLQAAMREAIDLYISAADSTNMSNFMESLLNIGRENLDRKALLELIADEIFGAMSNKQKTALSRGSAYGGKLKRNKRKGLTC